MARDRSTVKRSLAALALLEEADRVTNRGKIRHWVKRRGEKEYFNNIAATERLTVTLRFLATGETYFDSGFHSSRAFNDCFVLSFSICGGIACTFFGVIENFSHSPYRILTSTRNARSSESLPWKEILSRHARVQQC